MTPVEILDTREEAAVRPAGPLAPAHVSAREDGGRDERLAVLLVDADAPLRTVAKLHLAAEPGLEVVEAADERAALEIVRARPIGVVVGRLHGPRFRGSEFLVRLRAGDDPRLRALPVLLVTGARSEEVERLCRRLAPACSVSAPVTGPRLAEAVRRLAGRG